MSQNSRNELSIQDNTRKSSRERHGSIKYCGECYVELTSTDYAGSKTHCKRCYITLALAAKKEVDEYTVKSKS